jgi:hypothetical protein
MIPDTADPAILVPEKKTAVRLSDNEERQFYHIRAEGQDYWIQDLFLAVDAIPGIIFADNTFLYTEPDISAISSNALKLPLYALVGVHMAESTPDFICVSAYVTDFSSTVVDKQFIKRDTVTSDSLDLRVFRLYRVAEASSNETVKRELLNDAMSLGSSFNYLISEALDKMNPSAVPGEFAPFTVATYDSAGDFVTVDEANGSINIRNKPGIEGSEILFTVPAGTGIVITGITNETETIDDYDDHWYQVTIPSMDDTKGWVFGRYIGYVNP